MEILDKYPIKSELVASRILQDEAVIVLPMESTIYTFDPVGTRIFELSTGRKKVAEIINTIQDEYDVQLSEAKQDTIEFINDLSTKKILSLKEAPVADENDSIA